MNLPLDERRRSHMASCVCTEGFYVAIFINWPLSWKIWFHSPSLSFRYLVSEMFLPVGVCSGFRFLGRWFSTCKQFHQCPWIKYLTFLTSIRSDLIQTLCYCHGLLETGWKRQLCEVKKAWRLERPAPGQFFFWLWLTTWLWVGYSTCLNFIFLIHKNGYFYFCA